MALMIIDATKEEACRAAEAAAIRAKTGSSSQISYDFANGKGFAAAISAIQTGGSGSGTEVTTLVQTYGVGDLLMQVLSLSGFTGDSQKIYLAARSDYCNMDFYERQVLWMIFGTAAGSDVGTSAAICYSGEVFTTDDAGESVVTRAGTSFTVYEIG